MRVKPLTFTPAELNTASGTTKVAYVEYTEAKVTEVGNRTFRLYGNHLTTINQCGDELQMAIVSNDDESVILSGDSEGLGRVVIPNNTTFDFDRSMKIIKVNVKSTSSSASSNIRVEIFPCAQREEIV